jgi:hypothetical protein
MMTEPARIEAETIAKLGFDLDEAIAAYQAAKEAHKLTIGVPAPTAHPLVEAIVNNCGGQYEVYEPPKPPAKTPPEPPPELTKEELFEAEAKRLGFRSATEYAKHILNEAAKA